MVQILGSSDSATVDYVHSLGEYSPRHKLKPSLTLPPATSTLIQDSWRFVQLAPLCWPVRLSRYPILRLGCVLPRPPQNETEGSEIRRRAGDAAVLAAHGRRARGELKPEKGEEVQEQRQGAGARARDG
jgi:hypothetical protein